MIEDPTYCSLPVLIQGGMGAAVSHWSMARAVARRGHLGVVSGTAIDHIISFRLQEGDRGGHIRRAFEAFPDQEMANRVYDQWYQADGLPAPGVYRQAPVFEINTDPCLVELGILGAFAEVWLAKEEGAGPVGINMLEKIQPPTLPLLYGAILAKVDYVLIGAGIPRSIPGHLDSLARHEPCQLRLDLKCGDFEMLPFDPGIVKADLPPVRRPRFLAIVGSHVLAMSLARSGGVDGFIVEGPTAGGHNAPPRGWEPKVNDDPVYGPRDALDIERIASLGLPFWLAGGQDRPDSLAAARALGATGIQVGTAFAFCSDSGMEPGLRRRALKALLAGEAVTRTEGRGSPSGFPFKVLDLAGTEGGRPADQRSRQACHGLLRHGYRKADGSVGWRCPAEYESAYVAKGGAPEDLPDRRCLFRGLTATAGHPFRTTGGELELPLITSGMIEDIERFVPNGEDYTAADVIDYLGIPDGPGALPR